ncbi:MAG: class A beta-lactamase [Acidobacteriaceae bacterium]
MTLSLPLLTLPLRAQSLQTQIARIAAQAHGRVGVACSLPGKKLDCDFGSMQLLPMQSVYKLPIALTMLHEVEQGRYKLDQPIRFRAADVPDHDVYSPLRDQYPNGNVDVQLEDLLGRAVTQSDNVACDILLRLLDRPGEPGSGPAVVTAYIRRLGIAPIAVVDTERALNRNEMLQYRDSATPRALVTLLRRVADRSPITPEHTQLLLSWMISTHTADERVRAELPPGTVSADKTGTSGMDRTTDNATNDIALITLPDGRRLALAVLVADAKAPYAVRERVIAEIAKAIDVAATRPAPVTAP